MIRGLADLDELVLLCRNEKAKSYINEAVSSYRVGAYRASIVACWIAVCFDLIEKFRELALSGDKQAEVVVADLDSITSSHDLQKALRFEREILSLAKVKFDLISPIEHTDLERLFDDRNRCAHPSLTTDQQAYIPSAELARLHIHSAITHLLQHPPAQGKYALERLKSEIESKYFPKDCDNAVVVLSSGPLKRPRESLLRNFIVLLSKEILGPNTDYSRLSRFRAALQAVIAMHPESSRKILSASLQTIFKSIPDDLFRSCFFFIRDIPDTWQHLEADQHLRISNYLRQLPTIDLDELDFYLEFPYLSESARHRVKAVTIEELDDDFLFSLPSYLSDRLIDLTIAARTEGVTNKGMKLLAAHSSSLSPEQMRRALGRMNKNPRILNSDYFSDVISAFRRAKKLSTHDFNSLTSQNGLDAYYIPF